MLSLESPDWSKLRHAYGFAPDIPELLRRLEGFPDAEGDREPWLSIWSALAHQGDVYPASFAAVPHIVRVLSSAPERAPAVFFQFPAWVEICRARNGVTVPADLAPTYAEALRQLPVLVGKAADRAWDADLLRCAMAALAAAKGFPEVAEAAMELSPAIAPRVLKLVFEE
jgi:hypothetical protein